MKTFRSNLVRFSVTLALPALALAAAVSCKKEESVRLRPKNSSQPGAAQIEVCNLINKDEMEKINGSPVTDTKASSRTDGGFRVAQCYYSAAESSKSVSLAVTDNDPAAKGDRGAGEYWEETFGRYDKEESGKLTESEKEKKESLHGQKREGEEEEKIPPKKITGVGDAAYWSGNRVGGALYVLKKDRNAFVRISVGGPDNEEKKIEKSKALALKALGRL